MKILLTHELFLPEYGGGGEQVAYQMAKNLQEAGHEVTVLTTGNPNITSYKGIKTIRLPINRFLMNFAILPIMRHAKDVDLIQTCTFNATLPSWVAAKLSKKPIVCIVFGIYGKRWKAMQGFLKGNIFAFFEKLQIKRSYNKTIFVSSFSQKWAEEDLGIPKKQGIVINPGVELANFIPKKKKKYVLFSSRFTPQKGVLDVLAVARRLPDIEFIMMGWGEEETRLKQEAPKNITFSSLSQKSGKPFFDMYAHAPIFFLPSYGEGFGLVLVEAMSAGCAIVSTIPLGYEGKVVQVGDIEGMAKYIEELANNPKKAAALGKKNIALSKKYTWKNFTKSLLSLYKSILRDTKNTTFK